MSLTHCPLCVGLAVLSAVRFMAHAVMLWQWLAPRQRAQVSEALTIPWQPRPAA